MISACLAAGAGCARGELDARGPLPLTLDLRRVDVRGEILLDGSPPGAPASCSHSKASVRFDTAAGSSFTATVPCEAPGWAFSIAVPRDTYRVSVSLHGTGPASGSSILVEDARPIGAAVANLPLDIRTVTLSGEVLVDDQPIPCACASCPGAKVSLGGTSYLTVPALCGSDHPRTEFSARVPAGRYSVYLEEAPASPLVPPGFTALGPAIDASSSRSDLRLSVRTSRLRGRIRGVAPSACADGPAALLLAAPDGSTYYQELPCVSPETPFDVLVANRTFEVRAFLPSIGYRVAKDFEVSGPRDDLLFDLPTASAVPEASIPVTLTSPGGALARLCAEGAKLAVSFSNDESTRWYSSSARCGADGSLTAVLVAPPGAYDVWFSASASPGETPPSWTLMTLLAVDLQAAADSPVALTTTLRRVRATLLVEGEPLSPGACALLAPSTKSFVAGALAGAFHGTLGCGPAGGAFDFYVPTTMKQLTVSLPDARWSVPVALPN